MLDRLPADVLGVVAGALPGADVCALGAAFDAAGDVARREVLARRLKITEALRETMRAAELALDALVFGGEMPAPFVRHCVELDGWFFDAGGARSVFRFPGTCREARATVEVPDFAAGRTGAVAAVTIRLTAFAHLEWTQPPRGFVVPVATATVETGGVPLAVAAMMATHAFETSVEYLQTPMEHPHPPVDDALAELVQPVQLALRGLRWPLDGDRLRRAVASGRSWLEMVFAQLWPAP